MITYFWFGKLILFYESILANKGLIIISVTLVVIFILLIVNLWCISFFLKWKLTLRLIFYQIGSIWRASIWLLNEFRRIQRVHDLRGFVIFFKKRIFGWNRLAFNIFTIFLLNFILLLLNFVLLRFELRNNHFLKVNSKLFACLILDFFNDFLLLFWWFWLLKFYFFLFLLIFLRKWFLFL